MASIRIRPMKDGTESYHVSIRRKDIEICKSFSNKEDAMLFAAYKERLIDNMDAFEIPINERVSLKHIFELKSKDLEEKSPKEKADYLTSQQKLGKFLDLDIYVHKLFYDDWKEAATALLNIEVFKGAKTESGKRTISPSTVRKIFAHTSSAFSYAQSQGINLENLPLKVMQTYLNPLIKNQKTSVEE